MPKAEHRNESLTKLRLSRHHEKEATETREAFVATFGPIPRSFPRRFLVRRIEAAEKASTPPKPDKNPTNNKEPALLRAGNVAEPREQRHRIFVHEVGSLLHSVCKEDRWKRRSNQAPAFHIEWLDLVDRRNQSTRTPQPKRRAKTSERAENRRIP